MGHCLVLSCFPLSLLGLIYACSILVLYFFHLHAAFVHLFFISFCHFSYTRYTIMPRLSKFNNAKKRWKTSALKLQHANRWKISKAKCCACGKIGSNTVHLQIEKSSNEIFCLACLKDCKPSETWWGRDDPTEYQNENDACDNNPSENIPFHTLGEQQTWEEAIGQWRKNMRLVPSKGEGMLLPT